MAVTWDATAFMVSAKSGHFHKVGSSFAADTNIARVGSIAVPGKAGAAARSIRGSLHPRSSAAAAAAASAVAVGGPAAFSDAGSKHPPPHFREDAPVLSSGLDSRSERGGEDSALACVAAAKSGDFHKAGSFAAEDASVALVHPLAAFDAVGAATFSAGRPKYATDSIVAPLALAVRGSVVAARGW